MKMKALSGGQPVAKAEFARFVIVLSGRNPTRPHRAVGARAGPLHHICRSGLGCCLFRPLTFIWLFGAAGIARPINPYRIARLLRPILGMVASSKS